VNVPQFSPFVPKLLWPRPSLSPIPLPCPCASFHFHQFSFFRKKKRDERARSSFRPQLSPSFASRVVASSYLPLSPRTFAYSLFPCLFPVTLVKDVKPHRSCLSMSSRPILPRPSRFFFFFQRPPLYSLFPPFSSLDRVVGASFFLPAFFLLPSPSA